MVLEDQPEMKFLEPLSIRFKPKNKYKLIHFLGIEQLQIF